MEYTTLCILLALVSSVLTAAACPSGCYCLPGRLECEQNTVLTIPVTNDANISFVSLNNNRFAVNTLTRSNFSHLRSLVELTMRGCGIENIQQNTFKDLVKLTLLDLSLNNLRAITPGAFSGLRLNYLFLGDNPSITLPPAGFTEMSTEVVDLKNCQLSEIPKTFFIPIINHLKKLYIGGNKIERFSPDMQSIFQSLDKLMFQENPLICDCQSRWLKVLYDQNPKLHQSDSDGQQQPRCSHPASVAGEFFNRLTVKDFLCDKPTMNTEIRFEKEKGVLRCISRGHPPPLLTWHRPTGAVTTTRPTDNPVTVAEIEADATDSQVHGVYRCVATNEAGNSTTTVNLTWPFTLWNNQQPCPNSPSSTPKEILIQNNEDGYVSAADTSTDVFKRKYFTIIDIIAAVFGTFAGTLVITVLVLHMCVYRKRKSSSQYSTPPQSEYSASSIKAEGVYPSTTQHSHLHTMQNLQNRPLPTKPCHKAYDENHYMSTQLDDSDDLVRLGHHNAGALVSPLSPPCQACQTLNSQHIHPQGL